MESIIKPKQPTSLAWKKLQSPEQWVTMGYPAERWFHPDQNLMVISAVEVANNKNDIKKGPEYHVSISKLPNRRCSSNEAKRVLIDFGMTDAEEDNHVPGGFVRNYWMPVNENLIGVECRCKESEPAIVEDKGDFVWRGITD